MEYDICNRLRLEAYREVERLEDIILVLEKELREARRLTSKYRNLYNREKRRLEIPDRELKKRLDHAIVELAKPVKNREILSQEEWAEKFESRSIAEE